MRTLTSEVSYQCRSRHICKYYLYMRDYFRILKVSQPTPVQPLQPAEQIPALQPAEDPPQPAEQPPAPQPPIQDPEADKDIKNKGKQRTITRWGHCTDFNELEALEIQ